MNFPQRTFFIQPGLFIEPINFFREIHHHSQYHKQSETTGKQCKSLQLYKNENINNNESDNTNNKSDNTNNKGTDKKITVGKVTIKKIRNVKGRKIEIQYNKINKADGYQIRYSLKSNMSSSKIKTTTKTKYTLTSLKKKKKYYIQVRAFGYDSSGDKVYGKWSAKKSVKINK